MYWDVVEVRAESDCTLWVRFADGVSGTVRVQPEDCSGVLAPLRDPVIFRQAYVEHGAVSWPGGLDWAPESLYREVVRGVRRAGD